jgi:tRNA threonylcarbamoyladenosine biosynthesis protein TsaE
MPRSHFKNKSELEKWVKGQAAGLQRPCVVLLDGALGAGKTQTVRWFCEALGAKDPASPTFAVHHEYPSPGGPVGHVDLYRVKSDADLENSGFWDLLRDGQALLFVEWAERLPRDTWPASWTKIFLRLENAGEEERNLDWEIIRP